MTKPRWKGIQVLTAAKQWMVKCGIDYTEVGNLGMQKCNNFYPTEININVESLFLLGIYLRQFRIDLVKLWLSQQIQGPPLLILHFSCEEVTIHQDIRKKVRLGCSLPKLRAGEMLYSNWSLGSVTFPLSHLRSHLGSHWSLVAILHWYTLQPLRCPNLGDMMNVWTLTTPCLSRGHGQK